MVQVLVTHMVWYMYLHALLMSLALPKVIKKSRLTHKDSWKPEIKLLSAKDPKPFKWKLSHLTPTFVFKRKIF